MGEILFHDFVVGGGFRVNFDSTYDYDLIVEGYRVDVKTKKTTVIPQDYYLCSISTWNTSQDCDYYVFVRVNENLKEGYILGYKGKNEFFNQAFFRKKGELDVGGWVFKDDCYNLEISGLISI